MIEYKFDGKTYEKYRDDEDTFFIVRDSMNDYYAHFHSAIEIRYLISGKTVSQINGTKKNSEKDDIIFSNPYDMHQYFKGEQTETYSLIVGGNWLREINEKYGSGRFHNFLQDKEKNREILPLFELLHRSGDTLTDLEKKSYVNLIFVGLMKSYERVAILMEDTTLVKVVKYIRDHYAENLNLEFLAKTFGYAPMSFSRMFRKKIGVDLRVFINGIRCENIRRILLDQDEKDKTLISIVYECGFTSMATFYRSYKQRFNELPKRKR